MVTTKKFDLSDVLSITTGRLVSERHMDGIYEILNFMTDDNLFTHVLPRAAEVCKPWIMKQYSNLPEDIDLPAMEDRDPEVCKKLVNECVNKLKKIYGNELEIESLPDSVWESKNPIEELQSMLRSDQKLIVVDVSGKRFVKKDKKLVVKKKKRCKNKVRQIKIRRIRKEQGK